jgi:hypothetical protein
MSNNSRLSESFRRLSFHMDFTARVEKGEHMSPSVVSECLSSETFALYSRE